MTSALRRTALAAALVALSGSALAEVVVIDFETLGAQAVATNAPVAITSEKGFNFSGGFVYATSMLAANDPKPGPNNTGGFLANRNRGGSNNNIVLSLDDLIATLTASPAGVLPGSAYPNQFISAISFSLFTPSPTPTVTFTDRNNVTQTRSATPGGALWSQNNSFTFDPLDQVSTLTFSVGGGFFALDNLSITLTDGGTNGNVPEPTSYALVGLALLLAGSASRRRS